MWDTCSISNATIKNVLGSLFWDLRSKVFVRCGKTKSFFFDSLPQVFLSFPKSSDNEIFYVNGMCTKRVYSHNWTASECINATWFSFFFLFFLHFFTAIACFWWINLKTNILKHYSLLKPLTQKSLKFLKTHMKVLDKTFVDFHKFE